jgi:hypothetical protein
MDRCPSPVRVLVVLGLLWGLAPAGAHAQSLDFDEHTVEAETATWMGFALDDLNQDGLQDVVVQNGGNGGPLLWYEAGESGTTWTRHLIAEKAPNGPRFTTGDLEVGDFNGDGHLDVLAGENGDSHTAQISDDGEKQVRIFLNEGGGEGWTPVTFSNQGLYNGRVADIDGDGTPDVAGPNGHEGDPYTIYLTQLE